MKICLIILVLLILPIKAIGSKDRNIFHGKGYYPDSSSIKIEKNSKVSKKLFIALLNTRLNFIFREYGRREETTEGIITIKFSVDSLGQPFNSKILKSTTGNKKFDNFIKKEVDSWNWFNLNGDTLTATVPFKFVKEITDTCKEEKKLCSDRLSDLFY